jgi:hypothetical protein
LITLEGSFEFTHPRYGFEETVTCDESDWLFLGCLLCFTTVFRLPACKFNSVVLFDPVTLSLLQPCVPTCQTSFSQCAAATQRPERKKKIVPKGTAKSIVILFWLLSACLA